jgi:hypothetical protein
MHKVPASSVTTGKEPFTAGNCCSQSVLIDPPESVLRAIHKDDRDLFRVTLGQFRVIQNGQLVPSCPGFVRDLFHNHSGVVTQMAPGLADQGDSWLIAGNV